MNYCDSTYSQQSTVHSLLNWTSTLNSLDSNVKVQFIKSACFFLLDQREKNLTQIDSYIISTIIVNPFGIHQLTHYHYPRLHWELQLYLFRTPRRTEKVP